MISIRLSALIIFSAFVTSNTQAMLRSVAGATSRRAASGIKRQTHSVLSSQPHSRPQSRHCIVPIDLTTLILAAGTIYLGYDIQCLERKIDKITKENEDLSKENRLQMYELRSLALKYACQKGQLGDAQLLIDLGAEINELITPYLFSDNFKLSPLMLAVINGNTHIVEYLLGLEKLDVNLVLPITTATGEANENALSLAIKATNLPIVELLLNHKDIDPSCECVRQALKNTTPEIEEMLFAYQEDQAAKEFKKLSLKE